MEIDLLIRKEGLFDRLAELKEKNRIYSDIIDDAGCQYVDLVMEGGGMLGIALVGYTWALEQAGIRFMGIGGASAGAINAMLLAALGPPWVEKSPKVLNILSELDFYSFVDGTDNTRRFIDSWARKANALKLFFYGIPILSPLIRRLGLNPGKEFEKWLTRLLQSEGIYTLSDLRSRMNRLPQGLRTREGELLDTPKAAGSRLAVVAADITTETKVVFPDLADLYFENPERVNPAVFVRASMSIPFFFEPLRVRDIPRGEAAEERWAHVGYDAEIQSGGLPDEVIFVDGGIMSNFPIDLFHDYNTVPIAPTFGVKLQYDQRRHFISGPVSLFTAMFDSARHTLDYDFLFRNPDYKKLVKQIPCQGYNWLDFNMPESEKNRLFLQGARYGIEFLETFDWEGYKKIRKKAMIS